VTNYGPTDASGVQVTDIPPAQVTVDALNVTQGSYASGVWTVGSIVAGGTATMEIVTTVDSAVQMTNTATITAVDQPDGVPGNNEASATINAAAVTSYQIDLIEGWNLVSLPLVPDETDIVTLMTGVDAASVRSYQGGWLTYTPGVGGSLTTMTDEYGYWILMNSDDTMTFSGNLVLPPPNLPPSYAVSSGWNLISFHSLTAVPAGAYLDGIAGKWTKIWGYENGQFFAASSSDMLQSGLGYWLAVRDGESGTIYP